MHEVKDTSESFTQITQSASTPVSLILTIEDPIGSDFGPPSEKTYENSISLYRGEVEDSIDSVELSVTSHLTVTAVYRSYSGP